jgi:hypothetical protein
MGRFIVKHEICPAQGHPLSSGFDWYIVRIEDTVTGNWAVGQDWDGNYWAEIDAWKNLCEKNSPANTHPDTTSKKILLEPGTDTRTCVV